MHNRDVWTRGESGPKEIKGKTYKNLVEFSRKCASCSEPFSIFVTQHIASGKADSNSFGLVNCEQHRRNKSNANVADLEMQLQAERVKNHMIQMHCEELECSVRVMHEKLSKYELPEMLRAASMPWN